MVCDSIQPAGVLSLHCALILYKKLLIPFMWLLLYSSCYTSLTRNHIYIFLANCTFFASETLRGERQNRNNYFALVFFKGCLYLNQIFTNVYIGSVCLPSKWIHMKIHILCTGLFRCCFFQLLFVAQIILPQVCPRQIFLLSFWYFSFNILKFKILYKNFVFFLDQKANFFLSERYKPLWGFYLSPYSLSFLSYWNN